MLCTSFELQALGKSFEDFMRTDKEGNLRTLEQDIQEIWNTWIITAKSSKPQASVSVVQQLENSLKKIDRKNLIAKMEEQLQKPQSPNSQKNQSATRCMRGDHIFVRNSCRLCGKYKSHAD